MSLDILHLAQVQAVDPEAMQVLGQIGGALLVVIGLLFAFLFTTLGLLVRRMDRISNHVARMVDTRDTAHAEELRQSFAMIQILIDQHMSAIRDSRGLPPTPPPPPPPPPIRWPEPDHDPDSGD